MAAVRKDNRGYILRSGESQRKDGRYTYSYTDREGKRKFFYAKSLVELRELEKKIRRDREDGMDPHKVARLTLNDVYDLYMSQKFDLKITTRANYLYMYDHFVRDSFGKRKIAEVSFTDVKKFYYSLLDGVVKARTIENIHNQIHPALALAVRDGYLRANPSEGVMRDIKKSKIWVTPKRHALTIREQKAFMDYLKEEKQFRGWVPIMTVLLGTGMRIGECLALHWEDCDFTGKMIHVEHTLFYRPCGEEICQFHITPSKTKAGVRTIPMIDEVYDALLDEYEIQNCLGFCTQEIDGFSGFVFSTASGNAYLPGAVNNAIHRITDAYNAKESRAAKLEKREPLLLPDFSAHSLRHTFCTRLCENESNLKVIQSIMGHSDIQTTMDIYADCTDEKKSEVLANLNGKIII